MTTTANLIDTAKRHLLSGHREPINKLAADTAPGTGTLTFQYDLGGIKEGATVQVGLEVFHVWSVNESAKTATVEPAQDGSTAAAHDSGDLVTVNPKFPDHIILAALNDDLLDLSSPGGLYRTRTVDLTWVDTEGGYNLTGVTDLVGIGDVWVQQAGVTSKDWEQVSNYRIERDADTSVFPSGLAIYFDDLAETGSVLRVRYRSGFGQLTNLSDNVTTVTGLPATAMDIPPLGAAARLVRSREVERNNTDTQGSTRRANEVPPGALRRVGDQLWADRMRRIQREAARLARENPLMSYIPPKTGYGISALSDSRY